MTKEEINEAVKMHSNGLGYGEIAAALSLPKETIKSAIKRHSKRETFFINHCLICKKEFEDRSRGIKHKYCSDRCRYLAWKEKHKGETRKRTKKSICSYCGKEFFGYSNKHQKFCSKECATRYQHECK